MEKFATLQEIIEIYCISRKLVRNILRHYNIDCYKKEDEIYINLKEFHKVYTTKYNPVLLVVEEKKEEKKNFWNLSLKIRLTKHSLTYSHLLWIVNRI